MDDAAAPCRLPMARRALLRAGTALAGSFAIPLPARARVPARAPARTATANRAPLTAQPLYTLPTGAIRPAGWLARQLRIQADGLSGHLDETWPDVGPNSAWLGGIGEAWERGPYFLDGLVPLAWLLDDAALKAKAQRFVDWLLDHQQPDGMIGPPTNQDWWPRMVMLKVLMQYHELTEDPRVIPVMSAYCRHQLAALRARPLDRWAVMRWHENALAVLWLYNRTGDKDLLKLADMLRRQGFDWQGLFADFPFTGPVHPKEMVVTDALRALDPTGMKGPKDPPLAAHGVNHAEALKAGPIWSLVSGKAADRDLVFRQLATLDRYHGLPNGMYSATEHLAGRSPSQGIELCAVVEAMYSLEYAMAVTGSAALGDRIEKIAYNALPGTLTDDMWAHQYDQQPNQVRVSQAKGPWMSNGKNANLFGLAPNFGCCTANFHQGWPKLAASLWMASADGGLAATVYAPCTVETRVGETAVTLEQATDYPFRNKVRITVRPERAATFPVRLRVPAWAKSHAITLNGRPLRAPVQDGFARIAREWQPGDVIEIAFVSTPHAVRGHNGSVSFEDGPLVFALPIGEDWQKLQQRGLTADWLILPTSPWAFAVDPNVKLKRIERPVGLVPFSRRDPPVVLVAEARPVTRGWDEVDGSAADVPAKVPADALGTSRTVTLMPYAAPKLRLTSFAASPA